MAESHSEMSSEDIQELITQRDEFLDLLKWNAATLVIVLDHLGGTIEVPRELLEGIDLGKRAVRISLDEEKNVYIVESGEIDDAV